MSLGFAGVRDAVRQEVQVQVSFLEHCALKGSEGVPPGFPLLQAQTVCLANQFFSLTVFSAFPFAAVLADRTPVPQKGLRIPVSQNAFKQTNEGLWLKKFGEFC